MTTTRSAADDARDLPKEPTAPWILALSAAVILVWLGVLAWQVAALPERVPTHFGAGGEADGWSSRNGALAFSAFLPLLVVLPIPLMSRLVVSAPEFINAPNKEWWTASGARLRRFERLVREDLWLITVMTLALLVAGQVGIVVAAQSGADRMPGWALPGALMVFLVGLAAVLARMLVGGRYADQPDLD
ncbi:DUF1648 domain-containing protein [Dietzia sp. B32]|uniref:DUF1648 domain-containing protein n=1 Tax=Dietzia sp. B32 TaxID=2915130 RepID=UPI0021AD5C66|nr:DUF1648 domain-containing protein [Dietzia sp. B32]UVE96639.1 DUF1648 domain-containing protein [Dietzia sp. B32]